VKNQKSQITIIHLTEEKKKKTVGEKGPTGTGHYRHGGRERKNRPVKGFPGKEDKATLNEGEKRKWGDSELPYARLIEGGKRMQKLQVGEDFARENNKGGRERNTEGKRKR